MLILVTVLFAWLIPVSVVLGNDTDKKFDSRKMMSELESQLKITDEELSRLEPTIDEKSSELKKSIHETVNKGFIHLDELKEQLNNVSRKAAEKVGEFLQSEEMEKVKNYLRKIDEQAIKEAKDRLEEELTNVLELTEEQMAELKPLLDESLIHLSALLNQLAKEGRNGWEEFKHQYELLVKELRDKLQETLDSDQLDRYDKYNEEKKEKIRTDLFSV